MSIYAPYVEQTAVTFEYDEGGAKWEGSRYS